MRTVTFKNLIAEAQAVADGAEPVSEVPPAPVLTPRTVTIRIRARNPETGAMEVVELRSTVMDANDRARKAAVLAKLAQGVPLGLMHPIDAHMLDATARIIVQCGGIPEGREWLISGPTHIPTPEPVEGLPDVSPLGNLLLIEEALLTHERRYFLGDGSADSSRACATRVEVPWAESGEDAGEGA